ncbi:hypothetical protein PVK06_041843 [Gossypium arboreum]|uniref:Uncharacterized protein n=1 Tax=Gossypium arboreum TaxID=29729 RepID=A0ABR0N9C0_GOSAR|nr:hypothetical protein PVK06_041843 [Gossypium arboreum]
MKSRRWSRNRSNGCALTKVRNDMTEVATASTEGVDWGMATPSTMGLEGQ